MAAGSGRCRWLGCLSTTARKSGLPPKVRRRRLQMRMDTGESAWAGTGTRLNPRLDYTPPKNAINYLTKPLPEVPQGQSLESSLESQVDNVPKAPDRSLDNRKTGRNWERDVDDIENMWDNRRSAGQNGGIPKIDVNDTRTTRSDEILAPQSKQCVQKILKMTGKISPAASVLSPDSPTLHNSSQRTKQLTGLDVGSMGGSSQSQPRSLRALREDISPVSLSSSMYSQEGLETSISEPDNELLNHSYRYLYTDDEFDELPTPLSPLNYGSSRARPISTAPVSSTSMPAALCLSGFRGGNRPEVLGQVRPLPPADHYQHGEDSGDELWTSSRTSSSADRTIDLYHSTTSEIARSSAAAYSPPPAAEQRSIVWDNRSEMLPKSRLDLASSFIPQSPIPTDSRRKIESFSDRRASNRNRVPPPPPLEQTRKAPKLGRYSPPQRTPYPLPLSSLSMSDALDDEGGRRRFFLLSKVLGGGGGSSSKRDPSGSRALSMPSPWEDRTAAAPVLSGSGSARGAEGSWPYSVPATAAAPRGPVSAGPGIFQRTMESARQSVGLKSKAEKRRQRLRENIRVVGTEEMGVL